MPPIPAGYRSLTPYLFVAGAASAISWYARAFGARERMRLETPQGMIAHAEIEIGDSLVMLSDENPEMQARGPQALGGTPVMLHLYVEDVDATVARAVTAGATVVRPVTDHFYGDRSGTLRDPHGHVWHVASHVRDVPEEELRRVMAGG